LLEGTFVQHGLSQWQVYKNTFLRLDGVALGSLMAVVVHYRWMSMAVFRRLAWLLSLTVLPLAFVIIWVTDFFPLMLPPGPPRWQVVWIYPLVALGFAGFIGVLMVSRHALIRGLFANPVVTYVGKISYGLYVFHFPIHTVLFLHLLPPQYERVPDWVRQNAYIVLTFAAAVLSWHLFERPLLELKKRFQSPD
jgi:peptidoglycan/LPS O-acetylase OafA/YrhL